jgi:hypothetical protein
MTIIFKGYQRHVIAIAILTQPTQLAPCNDSFVGGKCHLRRGVNNTRTQFQ